MKRFISVLLVIALLVPMLCVDVFAADKTVSDFTGLKAAIAQAEDGDAITVASNITLDETLAIENKNITIKGSGKISAASALNNVNTRKNTLFYINGSTVTFNGLTLDGAKINRVIYSEASKITLTDAKVINGCPGSDSNINPGGGIFLRRGSLTATNTDFTGNTPGTNQNLPAGDKDFNGGAIYSGSTKADITITGGKFEDNEVKAYGHGAAIYQENGILNVTGTSFKNNKGHVEGGNAGTQGACIHTRDKVKATISNVEAEIAKGFNTGGFLRSWGSDVTVTNSTFTIKDLGDGYGYSGGALCFENGTSKVTGSTFTCTGSKLYHAGGFIDIVGGGTHIIDTNTMTGAGKENGQQIASFGGAISVEEGASATVTITNNTIKDTSASDNGGAIAIGTHKGKSTPSTVTMSGNTISNAGTLFWGAQYGGGVFVAPDATVTMTKDTIKDTRSSYGGGVYNEGKLTISGGSSLTGGVGSKLGGEIYNNGELTVDDATITGNFVGGAAWQQYASHGKNFELGGTNIYAEKDVTITPKANITTGKDVRVLDGQSKILLTGPLTKEIDVSVSETPGGNETQKRRVGYVVAEGTGYTVTKSDANFLHYIGRTNKTDANHYSNQPRASYADDKSTGEWDFVLDKDNKKVVLGQRVKLIYHGNLGKLGTNDKEEKTVDVYKNPNFWENQLEEYKVADPERDKYSFMAWYYWKDGTVGDEESYVQDIKKPDNFKNDLFDFSKVTFQNNVKDTDQIITPNIINTYAGWSQNISIPVLKEWVDAKEADKVDVTVTLSGGEKDITLTLKKTENYFNQFQDLKVFTKSYQPNEEKNMNLKFTPKTYSVEEKSIDGFTASYSPQSMIANQVAEVSRFVVTNKKMFKVTYEFVSGTEGKTLPAAIDGYKPTDDTEYADGATVNAKQPTQTSYEDTENNGTWTFTSWDANSKTIDKADVKFVGTWTFAETPQTKYKATYEFRSGTEGKELPTAIEGYKPTDDTEYADKATVTSKAPTQTSYEDAENNGTWTFTSWDANSKTIDKADVKFVGTWTFAETPQTKYKATYEFVSGTEGKTLPTAIEGYKPTDDTEYADKATVTAKAPTQTSYEDTENNGTWTFTNWDANSKTINKADVKFIGTWTFAAKPEPTSDFTITKTVDKAYYKKAGEVLTYTIKVKNTGNTDLTGLKLTDQLVNVTDEPFDLASGKSQTFTYNYTISEADVTAKSVTNTASVKIGDNGEPKEAKATSILKEKEKRGDVYVRYETEDGKILDEFAVLIDVPVGTYYYTEEKAFPRYRFVGLAPYSDPAEGYVVEGTQYVVYLYRRDRGGRTPDRRDRYEREEKEVEEPIVEAKRKPELNKKDHKQYMYGYPDWTFVPAANITRGEAAAMFARLFKEYPGLDYNYKKYYTDVDESYWGFKEVAYLSEFGILSGYSDGTFRPNNKITRAEFVKIAESFEALTWGLSPYNDVDGGHWAFRYIVSSAAKGWISGYPDGSFRPNSFISRAEAVTIVNKLLERRPDKDYIDTHKPELKPFTDLKPSYWAYYEIYEAVDGHDYNRSFTDIEEHWYRLNNERFVFSQPRYYR
ncbi:SHIRT domain-containing protein [Fenollaria timonensis]|uniref:SHIRT domain-containing protein n=1 Tax=Fenollaria timonensis TaxID=1723384 RepID=UPI00071E4837|nr:SHIRT domain-containing protein [Fenollaria timonensis]